jgi:hypothetical protein
MLARSPFSRRLSTATACAVVAMTALGCGTGVPGLDPNVVVIEHTDYNPPPPADDGLADDRIEDKQTSFAPNLVDRRPLEGWLVNQSEAVIRLDVPLLRGDSQPHLLQLHPSYQAARGAAAEHTHAELTMLPSVNLIDGKAKQFDDGLYAAIDQAYFLGVEGHLSGHLTLVERMLTKLDPHSPAAAFLAASLTLGGRETTVAGSTPRDVAARDQWIEAFKQSPTLSKPLGFYTWNDTLRQVWSFMRFLQQDLDLEDPQQAAVARDLVQVLADDPQLAADYSAAAGFFGKLTNPLARLSLADCIGVDLSSPAAVKQLQADKKIQQPGIAFFPPSTSRETELFNKLFPLGLPEGANLMRELVGAIRSGKIDLTPRDDSGWYDHQVYALETLLLPQVGEGQHKLLLTKAYKRRMLEAFQALITKRRETHVRQLGAAAPASEAAPPQELEQVRPRLRVEPCPSYFVRTARSYAFLHNFLTATLGDETLAKLTGLTAEGDRGIDLKTELAQQRDLFYGLYLVSCDDIGLSPTLRPEEVADAQAAYDQAAQWLDKLADDRDLAADTRVAVPIYIDPIQGRMRLWCTLGVRLTTLDARYARPPRLKPAEGEGEWTVVEGYKLLPAEHLIAVDEFAEVEIPTHSPPNREELRKLCDKHQTKEKIVEALAAGTW